MTREEAIAFADSELKAAYERVEKIGLKRKTRYIEVLEMAIQALEQEPCEDAISKRAVNILVDELARAISDERCCISRGRSTATIMQDILDLPSVIPQQTWIPFSERLPKHYDSHDLIHRETARRIIDSPRTKEQMLMVLASADNQKKTGHWVYEPRKRLINETDEGCEYITEYWCKCSECGGDFGFQKMSDAYCKYCGARMESEQNG